MDEEKDEERDKYHPKIHYLFLTECQIRKRTRNPSKN